MIAEKLFLFLKTGFITVITFLLVSCGGGGGDEAVSEPPVQMDPPVTVENGAPVLVNDAYTATQATALGTLNVLDNDSDPDGDTLNITEAVVNSGTVSINSDKTLTFLPDDPGMVGETTIKYTVSDGTVSASADAVINLTGLSAKVSWNAPSSRENGSFITDSEIASYEISYRRIATGQFQTVNVINGPDLTYTLVGLSGGEYEVRIATIDTSGQQSNYSPVVSKNLVP